MPLHLPTARSMPLRILNKWTGAALLCLAAHTADAAPAQQAPVPNASSVCEPAQDWPRNLQCLSEKTGFIDIALQDSLRQLHEKLPPELRESLHTQQRDWEQRRDRDCTPTDRPASDSNALAYAALCRSKMTLQRTELLQSLLAGPLQPPDLDQTCPEGQTLSIPCLKTREATIDNGMNAILRFLLLRLPDLEAQKLHTEQQSWEQKREESCQLNGYSHEQADQIICRFALALERINAYRKIWNQTKVQP